MLLPKILLVLATIASTSSTSSAFMLRPFASSTVLARSITTTSLRMARKAGVAEPAALSDFCSAAGDKLLVIDVRNPNADVEPGDQKSLAVAGLPSTEDNYRPAAVHLVYDRTTESMPLPNVPLDTPIITHCGGGGRGQKAKDFLEKNGYTTVLNGGGPKETECWAVFGNK